MDWDKFEAQYRAALDSAVSARQWLAQLAAEPRMSVADSASTFSKPHSQRRANHRRCV
jgi:hypothetical protein